MARDGRRLVILLSEDERATIELLARRNKLPASTYVRRKMLLESEMAGFGSARGGPEKPPEPMVEHG